MTKILNSRLLPIVPETLLEISKNFGTPVWVTDEKTIQDRCKEMIDAFSNINIKIFYKI